ncbi:MAG: hypothetical protein AAFO95_10910 [Cyanobacteria bacterium J06600_6]
MKNKLRTLISQGKTEFALQQLIPLTESDSHLHRQALALSARYEKHIQEKNMGTTDSEHLNVALNRIHDSALELIERLPEQEGARAKKTWKTLVLWIGILGSVASIIGYSLRDYFGGEVNITEESLPIPSDTVPLSPEPLEDAQPKSPLRTSPSTGDQINIQVNDQGKIGNIITGDSNTIEIKQDF